MDDQFSIESVKCEVISRANANNVNKGDNVVFSKARFKQTCKREQKKNSRVDLDQCFLQWAKSPQILDHNFWTRNARKSIKGLKRLRLESSFQWKIQRNTLD